MFLAIPILVGLASGESDVDSADVGPRLTCELPDHIWNAERLEIVVSGGSSRGSYQAGQMWVLSNCVREMWASGYKVDVTIVGSSAGSINAVLLAADLATNDSEAWKELPENSIFFKTWIPLGMDSSPTSLDSTLGSSLDEAGAWLKRMPRDVVEDHQALVNPEVMDRVAKGIGEWVEQRPPSPWLIEGRTIKLALTAARHVAVSDEDGVALSMTEIFAFELDKDGVRVLRPNPPETPDYLDASDGYTAFGRVARLSRASSAIPVAFQMFEMSCEEYLELSYKGAEGCYPDLTDRSGIMFIDGGTLEGNPLRVARRVDGVVNGSGEPAPPFLYMDPDFKGDPLESAPRQDEMWQGYLQILGAYESPSDILSTLRNQSISLLLEDMEQVNDVHKSGLIKTTLDPYGNYVFGFLALYDRSFRVWDFYAGMDDAIVWVSTSASANLKCGECEESDGGKQSLVNYARIINSLRKESLYHRVIGVIRGEVPEKMEAWLAESATLSHTILSLPPMGFTSEAAQPIREPSAREDGGEKLFYNLMVLSHLRHTLLENQWDGSSDALAQQLSMSHHIGDSEIRFESVDLGSDSFVDEVRERMFWEIGQVYKRDALSHSPVVAFGGSLARQALVGGAAAYRLIPAASPLHYGGMHAAGLGISGALIPYRIAPLGRFALPGSINVYADFPSSSFADSARHLDWGYAADVRMGLQFGWPVSDTGPYRMVGPIWRHAIGVHVSGRVVGLSGEGAVGRLPPLWTLTHYGPNGQLYLSGGLHLDWTFANVFFVGGGAYLNPDFSETCTTDPGDCRNVGLAFETGVRTVVRWPFGTQQRGRR